MKNNVFGIILVVVLILGSMIYITYEQQGDATENAGSTIGVVSANYMEYTDAELAKAQEEGKDVAVFFHSKSCSTCKALDKDIVANVDSVDENTVILKADWDTYKNTLAKDFGVTKYHTVSILNDDGTVKENVKGVFTLDDIEQKVDQLQAATAPKLASTNYLPYDKETFVQAYENGDSTAVFFKSSACGSCTKLDNSIQENTAAIPDDTIIFVVDWDSAEGKELAAKYDVAKYHTVTYVDQAGEKVKNVGGLFTVEEVLSQFNA